MPEPDVSPVPDEPRLSVAAVARQLGIAPATLRTWDRRYGLGPTGHTTGRHRRYGSEDLARLEVMRRAVERGASAGEAARYARSVPLAAGTRGQMPPALGDVAGAAAQGRAIIARAPEESEHHRTSERMLHLPITGPEPDASVGPQSSTFDALVGELDYSMFIVTARSGPELAGCLVGFACQSSMEPARFLVCLARGSRTFRIAEVSTHLAVHFVPSDAEPLAELFGQHTGDRLDKFSRCAWYPGPGGLPILRGCKRWFTGRVLERIHLGDHVGFLLEPAEAHRDEARSQPDFHRARRGDPSGAAVGAAGSAALHR